MPLAPPYFRLMKQINSAGPPVLGRELPGARRFSAEELHKRVCEDCLVVDVRTKEAFATAHIPGSINIPFGPNLPSWAGWVLPYDKRLLIVPSTPTEMPEVVTHLIRVGLDRIEGYLDDGIDAWQNHGFEISQLGSISVHELSRRLKSGPKRPFVLDVRTEGEWNGGHIDGAIHIHGGVLKDRFEEVPRDRPIAVVCGTGYRGSIAASFLKSNGYQDVSNVLGGMTAWKSANLPTVR
jgi:hydroxyacylglutathione hydrolase